MLITHNNTWQAGIRKRTINKTLKLGPITLRFITIALIAMAALFYLAQSTQASTFKYKIMDLQDQQTQAQTDVKQLEVESARLQSLNELSNNAARLNLVPSQ